MIKVYSRKSTGAAAVEALLAEMGMDHDIVNVAKQPDGSAPDWFRAINPRGEVPTLELSDNRIMTESAAMMIYLADLKPGAGFAPVPTDAARADYLRWMVSLSSNAYQSDLRLYYPERYSTDPSHAPQVKAKATDDYMNDMKQLSDFLGAKKFVLGEQFSAVDIYAAMLATWAPDVDLLFRQQSNIASHYARVAARPHIRQVWDRHGMN